MMIGIGPLGPGPGEESDRMQTLDEMLSLSLLTPEQHFEIGAYIAKAGTPERILQMPPKLWRALALASVLMNVDADLTLQPPQ